MTRKAHEVLPGLIDALEAAAPHQLKDALESLLTLLEEDFQQEEGAQGLFAQLVADKPDNQPMVARLLREHETLRETGATLLAQLQAGAQDLEEAVREFARDVREHHRTEEMLVLDTYS